MSFFSKPRADGRNPDSTPKEAGLASPPAKPAGKRPPPLPAAAHTPHSSNGMPAAAPVSRTVEVAPPPAPAPPPIRSRPPAPDLHIGPPARAESMRTAPTLREPVPEKARPEPAPLDSAWPSTPPPNDDLQISIGGTFERLLSLDLDDDLATGASNGKPSAGTMTQSDLAEVRELFAQLASNHVRQVRDFMIDVRFSEATVAWVGICEPALRSLRRAADKLGLEELCGALDRFCDELTASRDGGGATVQGERKQALITAYDVLTTLMPQAFALDLDGEQREAMILQSLLLQVPGVNKVTIDKLYAAGLTTLKSLFLASPGDVAAAAGISESLATLLVERFRAYRDKLRDSIPDATRAAEREQIARLVTVLRAEQDEFERVSEAWTREAGQRKKELREARTRTTLAIQLELARLGEVDTLREVERLPVEGKLARLESFLVEARDKYRKA
jgi:hypothetical protein